MICQKQNAKKLRVEKLYLPTDRVRDAAVFEIVGIDLTGLLYLKTSEKVWICLYTCAVYRAVHLEMVSDFSTDTFLLALRMLIARRGRPKVLYVPSRK